MVEMKIATHRWDHPEAPAHVEKLTYERNQDARTDWALVRRPDQGHTWVVHLHGHGSTGDQIFTRSDVRDIWLGYYLQHGLGVISPNLRGNAWMCPAAVADLHDLLDVVRREYGARTFYFVSGSMGGTGNLIYAIHYPRDVALMVALCAVTDIASYHAWCRNHPGGVRDGIADAIELAYGGRPDQVPETYARHSVVRQAHRLTMPLFLCHATGDDIIPVEQSRRLHHRLSPASIRDDINNAASCHPELVEGSQEKVGGKDSSTSLGMTKARTCCTPHDALYNVTYVEIEGGHHDSPLHKRVMLQWLDRNNPHAFGRASSH